MFINLSGTFYRSVTRAHLDKALSGSVRAGRYSRADEPTLYLSSSPEGVEAAMQAHRTGDDDDRLTLAIAVTATGDAIAADGFVTLREAIESINAGANVNADVTAAGQKRGAVPCG